MRRLSDWEREIRNAEKLEADRLEAERLLRAQREARCPLCDGEGAVLGRLGDLTWYRCVRCGINFDRKGT